MAALLLSVAFSAPQSAMAQTDLPGVLVISEARFSGPGGPRDEYVEICNPSVNPITVVASDESGGFGVYARGPFGGVSHIFTIPNGTVIQGGRCVLGVGNQYSLSAYYGGEGPFLAENSGLNPISAAPLTSGGTEGVQYTGDIQDNTGIALFTSDNVFVTGTSYGSNATGKVARRLDAFGFRKTVSAFDEPAEAPVFREGTGLIPYGTDLTVNQYAYARKNNNNSDTKQDTNDNVADFYGGRPFATGYGGTNANIVQDTTTTSAGSGEPAVPVMLGAPGPEDLGAPRDRRFADFGNPAFDNFDPTAPGVAPNRERVGSVPNDTGCGATFADNVRCAPLGTFTLRFTYTNTSGGDISRLRFRIAELTTVNRGSVPNLASAGVTEAQQAILRAIDSRGGLVAVGTGADYASSSGTVFTGGSTTGGAGFKYANGAVVERFPPQPNGGGINSAWVTNPCSNQLTFPAIPTATGSGTATPRSRGGLAAGGGTCSDNTPLSNAGTPGGAPTPVITPVPGTGSDPRRSFSYEFRFGVQRAGRFALIIVPEADNGPGT
jgi:hypothetical protein